MEQSIKFIEAVISLRPNSIGKFATCGTEITEWHDTDNVQPTQEEVEAEVLRIQTDYDNKEYQRKRAQNYPAIADQIDMLWHAMDTGSLPKVDSFYDAIKSIKEQYPKP
jgi:hypothetical protein